MKKVLTGSTNNFAVKKHRASGKVEKDLMSKDMTIVDDKVGRIDGLE